LATDVLYRLMIKKRKEIKVITGYKT
jgi:hypothetical protein